MPEANNDFVKIEYESSSIADIIKRINSQEKNGIFLPYVQRDFVWKPELIYSLLDSLMRGYPIGLIRIWETTLSVNYREFIRNYISGSVSNNFSLGDEHNQISKQYILDGQQRIQSLYIAMYGSYDKKVLFFNLASKEEEKYEFEFHSKTFAKDGWINVHDFLENPAIINELEQGLDDKMIESAGRLYDIFKTNKNIRIEKLASNNLTDVANIFLLSNAGGVVLEPKDLIMATINAKWVTEPARFTALMNMIKGLGFTNPKELILQSCYAALLKDTGRIDGQTINNRFNATAIQAQLHQNIGRISASIVDVLTFVSNLDAVRKFETAHYNPIFILIAYRYTHGHVVWNRYKDDAKKFLLTYLFSIDKPTQAIIRALLAYVTSVAGRNFDLAQIQTIFKNNKKHFEFNPNALLDINISMNSNIAAIILYLIYYGQERQHGFDPQTMTVKDHIFPESKLNKIFDKKGKRVYSDNEIDSILNCELLDKDFNSTEYKGDKLPEVFFTVDRHCFNNNDELDNFIKLHAIPKRKPRQVNIWDIDNYIAFLDARKELLIERITANFGELVNDSDGVSKDERRLIKNLNKNMGISTTLTIDDD